MQAKDLFELVQNRDKRRNVDDESSFIIPVILEPCESLKRFKSIHVVDVTKPGGFSELVRAIKKD